MTRLTLTRLLFSICLLSGMSILGSNTPLQASSQNYQTTLNLQNFNGLTINSPSIIAENPLATNHSQTGLITFSPANTSDVTIAITTNAQCTVNTSSITILGSTAPSNSATVTFTAVNDGILETLANPCAVSYTLTSADPLFSGQIITSSINVTDWNPYVIIDRIKEIDENPLALNHSNQLLVHLSEQPSAKVTLNLTYDNNQQNVSPTILNFDATNWNTGLLVTTTAIYDRIEEASPLPSLIQFRSTSNSSIEFANRNWYANIPIIDYTLTLPLIVRTGAFTVLPILAFASFILILITFFVLSNRDNNSEITRIPPTEKIL